MLTHGYWHDFTVLILKCEEVMKIYRDHPHGLNLYHFISPYYFILHNNSKPLTAFTVGPLGFYECERMLFGLTNASATFQQLMETCLGELHLQWCIVYLDDIIIFSKTPKEHITRLRAVFEKLVEAGLKLKPSKCEFFKR